MVSNFMLVGKGSVLFRSIRANNVLFIDNWLKKIFNMLCIKFSKKSHSSHDSVDFWPLKPRLVFSFYILFFYVFLLFLCAIYPFNLNDSEKNISLTAKNTI